VTTTIFKIKAQNSTPFSVVVSTVNGTEYALVTDLELEADLNMIEDNKRIRGGVSSLRERADKLMAAVTKTVPEVRRPFMLTMKVKPSSVRTFQDLEAGEHVFALEFLLGYQLHELTECVVAGVDDAFNLITLKALDRTESVINVEVFSGRPETPTVA
jgi:hypothetical protein